jgi:EAL domain-containing protein (putative c-di-GMP-specific phosphodiesterase class I)
MAHSMNLSVIAEGVEETEQFDLLNQYGCDEIQGYLLSRPIEADDLLKLLKEPKKLPSLLHSVSDTEFISN